MNVSCPQCRTVFRVNPAKVPREGVRARCAICGSTFELTAPASAPEPAGVPGGAPAGGGWGAERAAPAGPRPAPSPGPSFTPTPTPPPAAAPRTGGAPFGAEDPGSRARRLARALVSDLCTYQPDLQERGLREGRLKELFREEIKKSWQQYVEQVGLEVAKNTPHFRDALNDILAKGQRVF